MHAYRLPFTRSELFTRSPLGAAGYIRVLWRDFTAMVRRIF